jgi:hypothetical protein
VGPCGGPSLRSARGAPGAGSWVLVSAVTPVVLAVTGGRAGGSVEVSPLVTQGPSPRRAAPPRLRGTGGSSPRSPGRSSISAPGPVAAGRAQLRRHLVTGNGCRPPRGTTTPRSGVTARGPGAAPSKPTSRSCSPPWPSAAGSKTGPAGQSGSSSAPPAATAPSRSRPATTSLPSPTPAP